MLLIAAMAACALPVLAGGELLGAAFTNELVPHLGLDRLSAIFLLMVCLLGLGSAFAALSGPSTVGWFGFVFLAAMGLLLAARDAITFLIAWEAMSLVPAAAILAQGQGQASRKAVLIYIGTTHLGGVGVWLGMLYMAGHGALSGGDGESVGLAIAIATALGFATKAGLVPLHFWLPRAHPLAPAPISALMSGAMVALPLYATIRLLFEWLYPAPIGLGWGLVAIGALSAVLGAYSAAMAGEIKRLLAFSTVENIGLAAVAIGLAALLAGAGKAGAAGLALAVAIFQLLAHGVAKSALFIASGALGVQLGSLELDHLGGLVRRMPQLALAMTVAAFSLAAVPPLAGFAAEWGLLQSLLAAPSQLGAAEGVALCAVAAAVGLTAGLALLAFCKLLGLALLGEARRPVCAAAVEAPISVRIAMAIGASAALAIGLGAGLLLPWLQESVTSSLAGGEPVTGSGVELDLPGSGGFGGIGIALALVLVGAAIWRLRGPARSAPAPTWACGQPASPRLAWSGAGFVKTLRLATSLRAGIEREREAIGSGPALRVSHVEEAPHPFQWRLHRSAYALITDAAAGARRLQSGRLRSYLLYLTFTLVAALAAARLGVL
jgi:hydrogenase-4 component B